MNKLFFGLLTCLSFICSSSFAEEIVYNYDDSDRLIRTDYSETYSEDYVYDSLANILSVTYGDRAGNSNPVINEIAFVDAEGSMVVLEGIDPTIGNTLSWQGADQDAEDNIYYDVYLSQDDAPVLYMSGLETSEITLPRLDSVVTYNLIIVAKDNHNNEISSEAITFTTGNNPPNMPVNISPADNSQISYDSLSLSWSAEDPNKDDQVVAFDIYFGNTLIPELIAENISSSQYQITAELDPWSTYYWKVVAIDNHGSKSENSDVWRINPLDTDADFIPNAIEDQRCTSSNNIDSDNDGLQDNTEDQNLNGVVDIGETDPCNDDTDGDLMPDGWELSNQLDPLVDDGWGDADGDDESNVLEYLLGDNPNDPGSVSQYLYAGFEEDNLGNIYFEKGGYKAWTLDNQRSNSGEGSLIIDEATPSLSSYIETVADLNADGTIIFTISSELESYNYLRFYVDSVNVKSWSGENDFEVFLYQLTAGQHTFRWEYYRDNSSYQGKAWIDDVVITNAVEDADSDGINDTWELSGFGTLDNDMSQDTDGDGLTDQQEAYAGSSPKNTDSDMDKLPDGWEVTNGLDPVIDDAQADADSDGIVNYIEYMYGTDPNVANEDMLDLGFEQGKFDVWHWEHGGDRKWVIDSAVPLDGQYSAKTPDLLIGECSVVEITADIPVAADMWFDYKMDSSSTGGYYYFRFYVDSTQVLSNYGVRETIRFNHSLDTGGHTLKWEYCHVSNGHTGTAWIDNVFIPSGLADTDSDGINDTWELSGFGTLDNDMSQDTDGDGLTDQQEADLGLSPKSTDSDMDKLPDGWEVTNGLDPVIDDAQADADSDGIVNYIEYMYGTDPNVANEDMLDLGFEQGKFDVWHWEHGGDRKWVIDAAAPLDGQYSAKTPDLLIGECSVVEITADIPVAADMWFDYKMDSSSTGGYYYFRFYVDSTQVLSNYGVRETIRFNHSLDTGGHTLKWEYCHVSNGHTGTAWIDNVFIPSGLADSDSDGLNDTWELSSFGTLDSVIGLSQDTDGDGLRDQQEAYLGLSPKSTDSDMDQLPDGWEVTNGLDPVIDDAQSDADSDGIVNYIEYMHGTDPNVVNEDMLKLGFEQGKFDVWHWEHGGDRKWAIDAAAPLDGQYSAKTPDLLIGECSVVEITADIPVTADMWFDYKMDSSSTGGYYYFRFYVDSTQVLSNYGVRETIRFNHSLDTGGHTLKWEYCHVSNGHTGTAWIDNVFIPSGLADTDSDGINDTWELSGFGTLDNDMSQDTDGDGLTDQQEADAGSSPKNTDSDMDKVPDSWEVSNGLDPAVDDAQADADGDGIVNYIEYMHGTDPNVVNEDMLDLGFEQGKFDVWHWEYGGDRKWTLDTSAPIEGQYSAKTPDLLIGECSTVEVTTDIPVAADIWFDYKLESSHSSSYYYFRFYVNNAYKLNSYGTKETTRFSYPLEAGIHTLKWEYCHSSGNYTGTAWIDNVFIPSGLADTDSDGINDTWELSGFGTLDNDMNQDTDGDGLTDQQEADAGSSPKKADTDMDLMSDVWEFSNGTEISVDDRFADPDGDLILNFVEYAYNLNPNSFDIEQLQFGFEDEEFNIWYWTHSGLSTSHWTIDSSNAISGQFSAKSGEINYGESSELQTTTITSTGEVMFNIITESGSTSNRLEFYIDGQQRGVWYGNNDMQEVRLPVTSGAHIFKWRYYRGASSYEGHAWIDDIYIPGLLDANQNLINDSWEQHYFGSLENDMNQDTDNDGVIDQLEGESLLSPTYFDTDADAMADIWELEYYPDERKYDPLSDPDGDGAQNYIEYLNGTNPNLNDSSQQKLGFEQGAFDIYDWTHAGSADWIVDTNNAANGVYSAKSGEINYGESSELQVVTKTSIGEIMFNLVTESASTSNRLEFYIDGQQRGVWYGNNDMQEVRLPVTEGVHTFKWRYYRGASSYEGHAWIDDVFIPQVIDVDEDGIDDWWERKYFGDMDHNMTLDTDNDGLTDQQEGEYESNPESFDSDGDLIPDSWEAAHGLDLLANDAEQDVDGDGFYNYIEYLLDMDPQTANNDKVKPGFEQGIFDDWYWIHSGDQSWIVDSSNAHFGQYSAKSGDIGNNQSSVLETIVHTEASDMFFYISTSTEAGADQLNFYVDDILQNSWSGNNSYQKVIYPVTAGLHYFKWEYIKDGQNSHGADAVWIDDLFINGGKDYDNDGITDAWEYHYFGHLDQDMSADTDSDGESNLFEYQNVTDPQDRYSSTWIKVMPAIIFIILN